MTHRRDFAIPSGRFRFGVRFRPALGRAFLRAPLLELTDRIVPLGALWGRAARSLEQQLAEARSIGQAIARAESFLGGAPAPSPIERAATWLLARRGQVSVDDLARSAGLSARQFRRLCMDASGLTPKRLARVIRFRHALVRAQQSGWPIDWAQLALDCGYFDQAHLINEFHEFAATTPAEYLTTHTLQPAAVAVAAD
jgi:transcriptional regulator GlxA family with amidase domain